MAYTLEQFAADCRLALLKNSGPAGRELVRQCTEKACADQAFVAKHLGPDVQVERRILYEDRISISAFLATSIKARRSVRRTIMGRVGLSTAKPLV
jgi:hypothetical protein